MTNLAGAATAGFADGTGAAAQFSGPVGLAVDSAGTVYVADTYNNRIRTITPAGVVTTLAGLTSGYADGNGTSARFAAPGSVAVDAAGIIYVADSGNHIIRKITPAGVVTTFAGSGGAGVTNGTGIGAQFSSPFGVAANSAGVIYTVEMNNTRVRKIE